MSKASKQTSTKTSKALSDTPSPNHLLKKQPSKIKKGAHSKKSAPSKTALAAPLKLKNKFKKVKLYTVGGLTVLVMLYFTPMLPKVLLYGLSKLPITVDSDNTLLKTQAKYIVVLGGGLSQDKHQQIVPNSYTKKRLQTALEAQNSQKLPLLLSGVEAPWMAKWLTSQQPSSANGTGKTQARIVQEADSMNTCENARFSSIKLKNRGINHVVLVTDAYHMFRARRQFGAHGIFTTPRVAPVQDTPMSWKKPLVNATHSRRALYEWVANLRDIYLPQQNSCRKYPPTER